jgi:hypothetical protein
VTLGGHEMENDKYEWMSLEFNYIWYENIWKVPWEGLMVSK